MKVSIAEYAKLCKVSKTIIYRRIRRGLIKPIMAQGMRFVDIGIYPPQRAGMPGRPLIKHLAA